MKNSLGHLLEPGSRIRGLRLMPEPEPGPGPGAWCRGPGLVAGSRAIDEEPVLYNVHI